MISFDEKKSKVLEKHTNKISTAFYNDLDYFVTTVRDEAGKFHTIKRRTEQGLFDYLYIHYYGEEDALSPAKMDKNTATAKTQNNKIDKKKTYPLDTICDAFGFQKDHAQFLLLKNDKQFSNSDPYLGELGKNPVLSYAGILWLIAHGCQSTGNGRHQDMMDILTSFYQNDTDVLDEKVKMLQNELETEKKNNLELLNTVTAIQQMAEKMLTPKQNTSQPVKKSKEKSATGKSQKKPAASKPKKATENKKKWSCPKNDPDLPELTDKESEWTSDARSNIIAIAKEYGQSFATVLKTVYRVMEQKYGVDWKTCKDNALDACGKPKNTYITKMRIVAYEPELRHIFNLVIADIDIYLNKK